MARELTVRGVSNTRRAWAEVRVYVSYVLAMVRPGTTVNVFQAYPNRTERSARWTSDELTVLIDEGRRQLDRQAARHDTIRDTAKTLLPIGLAALAVNSGLFSRVTARHEWWLLVIWLGVAVILSASVLGAGALLAVRATFSMIDINLLTSLRPTGTRALADAYLQSIPDGENTLSTRLSILRIAVMLLIIGSALLLLTWLLTVRT